LFVSLEDQERNSIHQSQTFQIPRDIISPNSKQNS
jgi:hypothetical protein